MIYLKKKILIIGIAILIVAIIGGIIAYCQGFFYMASGQQEMFMNDINLANSIIWYYGKLDPGREVTINCKKVTEFNDKTIGDPNNQYAYHAIIIFDFDGKMDITNDELLLIKDYCENKHYDLLYYGTSHINQFKECGFLEELDESECGFSYNGSFWTTRTGKDEYYSPYLQTGNWTMDDNERYDTNDEHSMWKFVIQFLADLVSDSMVDVQ